VWATDFLFSLSIQTGPGTHQVSRKIYNMAVRPGVAMDTYSYQAPSSVHRALPLLLIRLHCMLGETFTFVMHAATEIRTDTFGVQI